MANLDELRNALLEMASPNPLRDGVVTLLDDVITLSARTTAHCDLPVEMPRRHTDEINDLRSQLAGLQRLVETLVNERGEGRQSTAADDESRCAVCGWPLKATIEDGCVREVCSAGDPPKRKYAPHRFALEQLRFRAARVEVDRDRLVAEVERLTRERDEAIRERNYALQCTDERVEAAQMRMVEAIAQYLEQRAQTIVAGYAGERVPHGVACRAAGLTDAVDALRAGTWKEQP